MICAYCLHRMAREEAEAGLESTTFTVLPGDAHAAVTVRGGEALCLSHWSAHVSNVVEAAALVRSLRAGALDEPGRSRLRELSSYASPGHAQVASLLSD